MCSITYILYHIFSENQRGVGMKTEGKILIAFLLNLLFSIFETVGGFLTGSISILSDAVHDFGDALSIGLSFLLERKAKKTPDSTYTYGYARYSVLGSAITTGVLIIGSVFVIVGAFRRLLNPEPINYDGMLIFAIIGTAVNLFAAYFTHGEKSLNGRAVNLHMLEDVLGWLIVLLGALFMRFTDFSIIDPLISLFVAVFILINALKNGREILDLFLLKTPRGKNLSDIETRIKKIDGVLCVHHLHLWNLDGIHCCASMHIVTNAEPCEVKDAVRKTLSELDIHCATIETETEHTHCSAPHCHTPHTHTGHCHHHH